MFPPTAPQIIAAMKFNSLLLLLLFLFFMTRKGFMLLKAKSKGGGVDSVLIAKLISDFGWNLRCYFVGKKGSEDVKNAKR